MVETSQDLKVGDTVILAGEGALVKTIIALGEEGPLP
jgi:hypothetical protein